MDEEVPGIDPEKDFVLVALRRYRASKEHSQDWRDEVETCYDYVAGHQYSDEDRAEMEGAMKAPVTFNRTEVFVQAVCGLEALNRNEVQYLPRRTGAVDNQHADLWDGAAKYVNDDCDAEVHHSSAFRDLVISGMGWTETKMDYETNPDGDVKVERVDPMDMYWDHKANQRNLSDARWVMRVKPMALDDIKAIWPDKAEEIEYTRVFDPDWEPQTVHNASEAWKYENDQSRRGLNYDDEELYVAHYQYWERGTFFRVATPRGVMTFDRTQWNRLREQYPAAANMKAVPFTKRVYKEAFIAGWTLLEMNKIDTEDFTLQCQTGKLDRNNNTWYGLVRPLKDPQDWLNKLFSQILYILSVNAKGGLLAEKDAFDNITKAEEDWSDPSKIVWLKEGALQKGKIQERALNRYPEGQDRLMMFAMNMFQDVTGANLELLGLAERVQAGVLEAQRKQAGMTILAWAFDSLRAYRKRHGRILAAFIRDYISDGRLIRITGPEGQQYIPLMRDELAMEYDIIVAESPQSPNERERTYQLLIQLMPVLVKMGIAPPPSLFDYLPIPAKLAVEWKKALQGTPQEQQKKQAMEAIAVAAERAEVEESQSKAELNRAKADEARMKALD